MAVLGFVFFVGVLAIAVASIVLTVQPRLGYIVELLAGATRPAMVPVATRRRVRQFTSPLVRSEGRLVRAAA